MRVMFQTGSLSALTVFCGSFLLFMVQPMLGRTLLPVFGGSESVWCLCLASYQALLLAGYAYAHLGRRLGRRRRASVHLVLLALSLAALLVLVALVLAVIPTLINQLTALVNANIPDA